MFVVISNWPQNYKTIQNSLLRYNKYLFHFTSVNMKTLYRVMTAIRLISWDVNSISILQYTYLYCIICSFILYVTLWFYLQIHVYLIWRRYLHSFFESLHVSLVRNIKTVVLVALVIQIYNSSIVRIFTNKLPANW